MHVAVCIKQIIDPELPARVFRINRERKEAERGSASLVIGPFDLNALEVAVQLKERSQASKITVLTVGGDETKEALKRALAMGCDDAVLVNDPLLDRPDPAVVARVLAGAIRQLGGVDLVLCGRQDGDWDFGLVGGMLAEELSYAFVPFVLRMTLEPGRARMEREAPGGAWAVEVSTPLVASISNAADNVPRLPKVRDILMAGRKPVKAVTCADLGLSGDEVGTGARQLEIVDLFVPEVKRECYFIEGDDGRAKGVALAHKLAELKLV